MDINRLHYFVSVADHLSFSAAASACFISQAAISMSIHNMEKELGFDLFLRSKKSVELTPAGEYFLDYARSALKDYAAALHTGSQLSAGTIGHIRISVCDIFCSLAYQHLLQRYHQLYPGVQIDVEITEMRNVLANIRSGLTDVGITDRLDIQGDDLFSMEPFPRVEAAIVFSKNHPLAQRDHLTEEDLRTEHMITTAKDGLPNKYDKFMKELNSWSITPQSFDYTTNLDSILFHVLLHDSFAILPRILLQNVYGKLRGSFVAFPVPSSESPPLGPADYCAAYLNDNQNPTVRNFIELLHSGGAAAPGA